MSDLLKLENIRLRDGDIKAFPISHNLIEANTGKNGWGYVKIAVDNNSIGGLVLEQLTGILYLVNIEEWRKEGSAVMSEEFMKHVAEKLKRERDAALEQLQKHTKLHPISEWHEDMGDCIWWRMPIEEPPYCGNPLDSEWTEDYYTHFTRLVEPTT